MKFSEDGMFESRMLHGFARKGAVLGSLLGCFSGLVGFLQKFKEKAVPTVLRSFSHLFSCSQLSSNWPAVWIVVPFLEAPKLTQSAVPAAPLQRLRPFGSTIEAIIHTSLANFWQVWKAKTLNMRMFDCMFIFTSSVIHSCVYSVVVSSCVPLFTWN